MRYTVLPALWQKLDDDERSLRWLGRKAHVDPSHLSLVRSGERLTVNQAYAERISAALGASVGDFFSPSVVSALAENISAAENVAD